MNRRHRQSSGWTVLVLAAAALALGACGRKGALDLPPKAPVAADQVATTDTEAETASKPSVFNSTYGTDAPPAASRGRKKKFVLDPLLD